MTSILLMTMALTLTAPRGTPNETLALAKLCLVEVGWQAASTDDCSAILRTLQNRSGSIETAARREATRTVGVLAPMSRAQHWLKNLDASGNEPEGFVGEWKLYKNKWRSILREARSLLISADETSPCQYRNEATPAEPLTWSERPPGVVRLDCGYTLNTFYGVR